MSEFFDKIDELPQDERNQILLGLLVAQSLIRHIEEDGFTIPNEVAATIALFDNNENDVFAKAMFDLIFRSFPVCANDGDSAPWRWISTQNISVIKSLFCWLVRKAKGAIAL